MRNFNFTPSFISNGPYTTHQLRTLHQSKRFMRHGYHRLRRGWYALDPSHVGSTAVRAGGLISCVDALNIFNIWVPARTNENLHVRIPSNLRRGKPEHLRGIHTHQPSVLPPAVPHFLPYPELSWLDTLSNSLYCAIRCQSYAIAVAFLDSLLHQRICKKDDLQMLINILPQRYSNLLKDCDPKSQSGLESVSRLLFRAAGFMVETQVYIDGVGFVDMILDGILVIELDGRAYHDNPDQFAEDRRRDMALARKGYLVLRFTYNQIMHSPKEVLEAVRQTLAHR